jgi:regulator of sigma E protease
VQSSPEIQLSFVVLRGPREVPLTVTPQRRDIDTPFGKNRVGLIGIEPSAAPENFVHQDYSLGQSFALALRETGFIVERTVSYIGGVFVGRESTEQISGPIRIAEISGEIAKVSLWAVISLAGILSISIGLLNLAPIPLLDGGHLLYYLIEVLKGRPLTDKNQELGFRVGLGLVMALMLFATFNDILHVGPKLLRAFG